MRSVSVDRSRETVAVTTTKGRACRRKKKELKAILRTGRRKQFASGTYCLVSAEWIAQWKNYTGDYDTDFPPGTVDNAPLICAHSLLHCDPIAWINRNDGDSRCIYESEEDIDFCIVTEEQWEKLSQRYGGGPAIYLNVPQKAKEAFVTPAMCEDCIRQHHEALQQARFDYTDSTIALTTARRSQTNYSLRGTKTKSASINASCKDTIELLKLKVCEALEISPAEQRLYHGDTELKDAAFTLFQYKIPRHATICVERQTTGLQDEEVLGTLQNQEQEEGFKGTNLQDGASGTTSNGLSEKEHRQEPAKQGEEHAGWTCGVCTFLNNMSCPVCEMCEGEKPRATT